MNDVSPLRAPVIAALDVDARAEAAAVMDRLGGLVGFFKVGLQLYTHEGWPAVEDVLERGHGAFVDLKLHDIPNTVRRAVANLAVPGVRFLTAHASGGVEMIAVAAAAIREARAKDPRVQTKLLAVTILTSLDDADLREIGVDHTMAGQVLNLARLALRAGADGLVASPQEVALLRRELGKEPVIVTPGVRLEGTAAHDQKRVMTPAKAIREGSDFLVMGRSLFEAADPGAVLRALAEEVAATG
ncbi:MAG: orotidine-5'-phosphate decarboxylase [Verrucomicrobiae bacterium]|nr:orotidine-5'-phosphate decarboxylase [Verrucomicrobiae bacterium]